MTHNGRPSRAGDYPRITFHAQDRTFDRLLKESSLSDLKKTVRTKLGLTSGSVVQLTQLRHGQSIDLEDEDDFDAFYSLAYEQRLVAVQVTLTDNLSAEDSASSLEERPRKKRKHEVQTLPEQGAESHVGNHVSFGKNRKVAFTEPSAEIDEHTSSQGEPQKKRKKDDSSSIAAVAEHDRGSSHDSSEAPNKKKKSSTSSYDSAEQPRMKKKRKDKSAMDSEADDGAQSFTPSKHHSPLPGSETSHTGPKALPGADSDKSVPEHSTLNEQEGSVAVEVPATRTKKKGVAPTKSSTFEEALQMSFSSTTKMPKKPIRRKPDHANEKSAKPTHPPAGTVDDTDTSSESSDGVQKDDNLGPNVREKDGHNVQGETKNRKRSLTINANNAGTISNIDNGSIRDTEVVPATAEKLATNSEEASSRVNKVVTKKKKSTITDPSSVDASGGSPDRAVKNSKTKMPEDGAKKGAGSSKTSAETSTICLVCNRTPKHELVECPIVEEGPASIQKRIKSLRARKIPDLPLISELQKIKAEQKKIRNKKARVAKNVAIEPRSQSALSPSADEGTKDVGGHTNDVAGVSKESRPVNETSVSSGRSSGTPSDETLLLDAGTVSIIDAKWVVNNDLIPLPDIGDVSGLANLDPDVLMKGPESSFLSINDMPSSADDSDEEEKMSGEPDSEEVEKPTFAKLMRDDSSDSDTNDSQGDEPDKSEKHIVGSSRHTQSFETDSSSRPKHNEDDDTSGDSGSDVNAVRDVENTLIAGLSGGQVDDDVSAPTPHSSSPNLISTSEEQQNVNGDWEAKQDPLEGVSSNDEPPRPLKGREESSASSGRKHVKAAKSTKKTNGFSLSQVSKELEESAARNPKTSARVKNKLASNTSNRSVAKSAADAANVQRPTTAVGNWTTWKEDLSSHPDDDRSTLVDELLPSSPVATRPQQHRNKKAVNGIASKDDISEPPNSQPSLALSQKTRLQDPIEDAESNSEKEAKDGNSGRRTRNSRYRRLSEIRSESIHKSLQVPRLTPSAPRDKATELYGKGGRANETESESSSDSDSEVEKPSHSHIPKKRVAGIS